MKELNFDSGLVTYTLNQTCEITFNPGDNVFSERFYSAFDELKNLYENYGKRGESEDIPFEKVFDIAKERDQKMCKIIDDLFGTSVCGPAFCGQGPCAFANGFPLWLNLMLAVMDEIDANISTVQQKADPRAAKYAEKYKKYVAKYHK